MGQTTEAYWRMQMTLRERQKGTESLFREIMAQNMHNREKETDIQIQEAWRVLNKMNPDTQRHSIIKVSRVKDTERILKVAREKQL